MEFLIGLVAGALVVALALEFNRSSPSGTFPHPTRFQVSMAFWEAAGQPDWEAPKQVDIAVAIPDPDAMPITDDLTLDHAPSQLDPRVIALAERLAERRRVTP